MEVDGFSLEAWNCLFETIRANPHRFTEAMHLQDAKIVPQVDSRLVQWQIDLRKRVARKFLEPLHWVWSKHYLELCSDQITAQLVPSYFPSNCCVFDIGCGGGSDAVALAADGKLVKAFDKNDFAVRMTECNSVLQLDRKPQNMQANVVDADDLEIGAETFVHLDPDRRSDGRRSVQLAWHSPGPSTVKRLVCNSAGGSIKLAPGCRDKHEELGRRISRQWISMDHHVVQQRWWWGIPEVSSKDIWISSFIRSRGWSHEVIKASDSLSSASIVVSKADILPGMFIGDGDPALRASGFQAAYAARNNCALIGNTEGFFLAPSPLDISLVRWQKIDAILPLDVKRIKGALRDFQLDGIELKTRNTLSVSAEIVALSRMPGPSRAVLYAFRAGKSHVAVLCGASQK